MTRFIKDRNAMLSQRKKFNRDDFLSKKWNMLIQDGSLEKAYRRAGMPGVMELTGLKKSSAYVLISRAGLLKKVLKEKDEKKIKQIELDRLAHLKKYGWQPGQEYFVLKGKVYQFDYNCKFGKTILFGGNSYFISVLPKKSVVEFMVKRGLKYFIVNHKVEPIENFQGRTHAIAHIPKESHT